MNKQNSLKEVFQVFFKLGCFAFGGPAAHIAMMEEEVVTKRKWMSRDHFLDLIGGTNLIPGPNSTEMTMHCGHERAGRIGLFVAGISFIVPAVVITGILAWLYVEYGELPAVEPFILGIKPAVLAVIAAAVFKLGKKALKTWQLAVIGAVAFGLALAGVNEILALLGVGLIGAIVLFGVQRNSANSIATAPLILGSTVLTKSITTTGIFWSFLKVGAVLYGSGYVLFAYLDAELVQRGLMSYAELMDAIAVGQFTPGPVLSTSTFIGFQLGGLPGALAATAGIFLPSFLFVLLLNPLIPKMRKSAFLGAFLDSVNVAAVAIMAAVLLSMTTSSVVDWRTALIALFGIFFTFGPKKLNAMYIILAGSLLGYLLYLI